MRLRLISAPSNVRLGCLSDALSWRKQISRHLRTFWVLACTQLIGPLIRERDVYLAWSLKRSKAVNGTCQVLGVVGAGHVRGVVWALEQVGRICIIWLEAMWIGIIGVCMHLFARWCRALLGEMRHTYLFSVEGLKTPWNTPQVAYSHFGNGCTHDLIGVCACSWVNSLLRCSGGN